LRPHPIARRYAKALFELAEQQKSVDQIKKEVDVFGQILESDGRLRAFLLSPQVDKQSKTRVLENAISSRVSPLFYHFLLLLLQKGRQPLFPEIVFEWGRLYDKKNNRIRATLISAIALSDAQVQKIRKQLAESTHADLVINNEVDPAILGGLVIRMDGRVLDASLAHQLERMRKELENVQLESTSR
jgi:F-type H+-transporting ATPase subunit delta